jgi:hypothetical protein
MRSYTMMMAMGLLLALGDPHFIPSPAPPDLTETSRSKSDPEHLAEEEERSRIQRQEEESLIEYRYDVPSTKKSRRPRALEEDN